MQVIQALKVFFSLPRSLLFLGITILPSFLLLNLFPASAFAEDSIAIKSGPVNITTAVGGTNISSSDIEVATTCHAGYYLTLNTTVDDNNLYLGGDDTTTYRFTAIANNTILSNTTNTWGYSMGSFKGSPATFNPPTINSLFNAVPGSSEPPAILKDPASTVSSNNIHDEFSVYYGVSASGDLLSGNYTIANSGALLYAITASPACSDSLTVIFNKNAGEDAVDNLPDSSENTEDLENHTLTLSNKRPERSGYIFKEWNTAVDGTGSSYPVGTTIGIGSGEGELTGIVTLYAIWTEECSDGYICYDGNHADAGTMDNQYIGSSSSSNMIASNFSRAGYGFAGWNTEPDGTGTNYGPNQTITMPASGGLNLFARWIKASGTLQTWNGASSMNVGDVIALRDSRDNEVYTVAKLADDNVWMTENLRLVPRAANITAYNTNNPTNDFLLGYPSSFSSASRCSNDDEMCTDQINYYANNISRSLTSSYDGYSTDSSWYSYGVMYNWYTATAGNGGYYTSDETTAGDICPAGWRLPTGGESGEFASFATALGGANEEENSSNARTYPNNYVYGGNYSPEYGNPSDRNNYTYYWSSTAPEDNYASYSLTINSSSFTSDYYSSKWYNLAARCIYQGSDGLLADVAVDFSDGEVSSVTFVNDTYGTETATSQNPVVTIAKNASYTITATPSTGYDVTSWIVGANAAIGDQNQNPTTLSVTADSTLALTTVQATPLTINYHGNGLTFENDVTKNTVNYYTSTTTRTETETRYSHTSNVNDDGTQHGDYLDDADTNEVISIPGAESLHISLTYQTESTSYDWVSFWAGDHSDYSAGSDYESGVVCSDEGPQYGNDYMTTVECDILGDTVTFGFYSDSSVSNYYGYYAVITANVTTSIPDLVTVEGSYATPTSTAPHLFLGWSEDQAATAPTFADEVDIRTNLQINNGETVDLYAVYKVAYPVTVYMDADTTSIAFYNSDYGLVNVTTSGDTVNLYENTSYITTATNSIGYRVASWSTSGNGILGDDAANPTTFSISGAATLYAASEETPPLAINYHGNGLTFDNDAANKTVEYFVDTTTSTGTVNRYSHTPNVDDEGNQDNENPNYPDDANTNEVITIPGAESLHISLTYQTESTYYDWVSFWEGDHPDYSAEYDYDYGVICNNEGPQYGNDYMNNVECDVPGDTVTFGFHSDGGVSEYYGYYAVISATTTVEVRDVTVMEGSYAIPTSTSPHVFLGWSEDQNAATPTYTDEEDIKANIQSNNGDTVDLYAVYEIAYPVTVYLDTNTISTTFTNPTYGTETVTNSGDTVDLYRGAPYTITAEHDIGYELDSWSTDTNGALDNNTANPTTFTITGSSTLVATSKEMIPLTINYHGNGLVYDNDATENVVKYFVYSNDNTEDTNTASSYEFITAEGSYSTPISDASRTFLGWSEDQNAATPTYTDEEDIKTNLRASSGDMVNLYAVYSCAVTVNLDVYSNTVSFYNADYGTQKIVNRNNNGDGTHTGVVNLYRNTTYSLTSTFATDYKIDHWSTTSDGAISNASSANTTYTITDIATLDLTSVLKTSMLLPGNELRSKMKDESAKSILKADSLPNDFVPSSNNTISTPDSVVPTYTFSSDCSTGFISSCDTIYIYSEAKTIYLNPDSRYAFESYSNLSNISGLSYLDTSKVTDMSGMFMFDTSLTDISALSDWDTSSVTNMSNMFAGLHYSHSLSNLSNLGPLAHWDTSNVTDMSHMFEYNPYISHLSALTNWNTSNVTDMSYMFNNFASTQPSLSNIDGVANWDTSNVTNMRFMFTRDRFTDLNALANWNTSNVTDMSYMFALNTSLVDITGVASWDTGNVTDMSLMFAGELAGGVAITNLDAMANWDVSSVTNMAQMFFAARLLTDIDGVANWDVSSVTYMASMFEDARSLANIDALADWRTGNVESMSRVFLGTAITNLDALANWDTGHVIDMDGMFYNTHLADINGIADWDTRNVRDMSEMFSLTPYLNDPSPINDWDISSVIVTSGGYADYNNFHQMFLYSHHPEFTKRSGTWDSEGSFIPDDTVNYQATITVNFDSNISEVILYQENQGSDYQPISISGGTGSLLSDRSYYIITVIPKPGYELDAWDPGEKGVISPKDLARNTVYFYPNGDTTLSVTSKPVVNNITTMINMDSNISKVTFRNDKYGTVTISANGVINYNTINPDGTTSVYTAEGDTITLKQGVTYKVTASTKNGYEVSSWLATDGTLSSNTGTHTKFTPSSNSTLNVTSHIISNGG